MSLFLVSYDPHKYLIHRSIRATLRGNRILRIIYFISALTCDYFILVILGNFDFTLAYVTCRSISHDIINLEGIDDVGQFDPRRTQ